MPLHEKSIKIDLRASHPNGDATLFKKYAADTYPDEALVKNTLTDIHPSRDGTPGKEHMLALVIRIGMQDW